jgi:type IV pilus assembly protein PilA
MLNTKPAHKRGFTLIEILVVIGLIAILAAIVLIAINPARQFAQARNTQRESNVNTVLNAIGQDLADNKGIFGGTVAADICNGIVIPNVEPMNPAGGQPIGTGGAGFVNLTCLVPTYIPTAIPVDPTNGTAADTKYKVQVDNAGRITVCAPGHAETAIVPTPAVYCLTR